MAEILMIEQNEDLNRKMCEALTGAGHVCHAVQTIDDGAACLSDDTRMMTILNARLPWKRSISFLRALEAKGLPVLFLTSDPANVPHLKAMYASNCDVLVTPCDKNTLTAAVTRLLDTSSQLLAYGPLRMDLSAQQVTFSGVPLSLTQQEFALLHVLMQSPDQPITREHLLRTAWGYEAIGVTRTVDVHIQRLRRKLGSSLIETVYKTGYRLTRGLEPGFHQRDKAPLKTHSAVRLESLRQVGSACE